MAFNNYSGNLVGGTSKYTSTLTTKKSSSKTLIAFAGATVIVELYMSASNANSALGLNSSSADMTQNSINYDTYNWLKYNDLGPDCTHKSYDFKAQLPGNKIYVKSNQDSSPRNVFVLHQKSSVSAFNIYPTHLAYGPKSSSSSSFTSHAYVGFTNKSMNEWVTHTAGNGIIYMSITVNSNNLFRETTLSVKRGYNYKFNMHTVSQAGCDGIIISESPMTSGSVASSGVARCSGVDDKVSYTYSASSDGTLYIYFKTDSSNLGEYHEGDTNGNVQGGYDGFTTGDIEIKVSPIKTTVLFSSNGGTGGTSRTTITYGTDMSSISVVPPVKDNCIFAGYYIGNTRNAPGAKYIGSDGIGLGGKTWDIPYSRYNLYALYNYRLSLINGLDETYCVYCTSSPAEASTVQTDTSITLGDISWSSNIPYTLTYELNNPPISGLNMTDYNIITIPAGTASGDYSIIIRYVFTPDDTSIFSSSQQYMFNLWIISTYIVNESMVLNNKPNYLTQKKDIPAGLFTLSQNNLSEYFQYPIDIPNTQVTYNNGKSDFSAPYITWSIAQSIPFDSLGSEITSRQQVKIPFNSNIFMYVHQRTYNSYYSNRDVVMDIISNALGYLVEYHSQLSPDWWGDTGNADYDQIVSDIEAEYGITLRNRLKNICSVDLVCRFLYETFNIGSIVYTTDDPIFIRALYGAQTNNKVYREANEVTDLSLSVEESSIYVGDKTFAETKALFTSGDKVSVKGTYSGYDSSVINIDNNVTVICVDNVPDEGDNDYVLEYSKIYYYYDQYNGNYLFKKMYGNEFTPEYIVTDTNDFDVLLHASYEYNGQFTTPTHIVGRLNADMSNYGGYVEEVRIVDVY